MGSTQPYQGWIITLYTALTHVIAACMHTYQTDVVLVVGGQLKRLWNNHVNDSMRVSGVHKELSWCRPISWEAEIWTFRQKQVLGVLGDSVQAHVIALEEQVCIPACQQSSSKNNLKALSELKEKSTASEPHCRQVYHIFQKLMHSARKTCQGMSNPRE